MTPLSINKIRFFKTEDPPKKRLSNNKTANKKEKEPRFFDKAIKEPFVYLFVFVLIITYLTSYIPSQSLPELQTGEIASADIEVPSDVTLIDEETTKKRRREEADKVLPVYSLDSNIFFYTEEKIREFFQAGRELVGRALTPETREEFSISAINAYSLELTANELNALIKNKFSANLEEAAISLIRKISAGGIILTRDHFFRDEQERGFTLLTGAGQERTVRTTDILDIAEAENRLSEDIGSLDLLPEEKSILVRLTHFFISPNVTFDGSETESRKEQARASIETVFYTIKKSRVIIRKGDEVTAETSQLITLINQQLQGKSSWLINAAGTFLLFGLLLLTIWYYLKSLVKVKKAFKYFLMMGVSLVISLLIYKLSLVLGGTFSQSSNFFLLKNVEAYNYAFPLQFGAILFAFLAGIQTALIFTVLNSILIGYLFQTSFPYMIFCLIGGFAAIYGIKYYGSSNRTSTFRAALFVLAPVNTFNIITFHLISERMGGIDTFAAEIFMGLIGGLLSAALAFLFLPIFENIFSIITQSRLVELSNSDLPIFRQMAMEAPGSYHHSLIVSALAENAAEDIKIDTMLVKTAALYHDLGKIKRPEYFIENRTRSADMHKDLKPSMSALVIFNHVKEGVELAKKLKLPQRIRDVIEQHHGTSLVKFFFEKAKVEYDPEMQTIGEESYRYAGPKPQSKEAALVMIADAVEAASRSLKSPTKASLKKVINDLINHLIQDGQLDDSEFSLKELKTAAASFLSTLDTIYHQRVEYPGFDFERKKAKNNKQANSANDRNSKPAK